MGKYNKKHPTEAVQFFSKLWEREYEQLPIEKQEDPAVLSHGVVRLAAHMSALGRWYPNKYLLESCVQLHDTDWIIDDHESDNFFIHGRLSDKEFRHYYTPISDKTGYIGTD